MWDSNSAFSLILDNPTVFGFTDATSYGGTDDFWGLVLPFLVYMLESNIPYTEITYILRVSVSVV